jgi:ABC-type branched-subunit amino acid transport system substrate-binding protein
MYRIITILIFISILILPFLNVGPTYNEKEIRLGMSGPFSGNVQYLGTELLLGANTYFTHLNEQGGVYGRTIRIITKDDKYEPKITVENAEELINKDKVFALFGFVGTEPSIEALHVAQKYRIPYIGSLSGSEVLRKEPRDPLVLNGRISYRKEIEKLIEYFVDKKNYKKIAVFYQNDSYGRSGLKSVKKLLRDKKLELVAEGGYKRNTLSVGHALYEIAQSNPEVVIMVSVAKPSVEFIRRLKLDKRTKNIQFGAISSVGSDTLVKSLGEDAQDIVFSQVVPSPWSTTSPEVSEYRTIMDQYNSDKPYSYISLEGYFIAKMTAKLFFNVGENLTKEKFIDAMRHLTLDERVCKCLDKAYLTKFDGQTFWDIDEK